MSESIAWILDVGNAIRIAIGELEMVHLEEHPILYLTPKAPDYCQQTFVWKEAVIPVVDLVIGIQGKSISRENSYIAIIRYRSKTTDELLHAALLLKNMPVKMEINDEDACQIPESLLGLKSLIVACFNIENESIPVIDLAAVFAQSSQLVLGNKM